MRRVLGLLCAAFAIVVVVATAGAAASGYVTLPDGWAIAAPPAVMTGTDTFPQGAALSPNHQILAVVCSGYNAPTLRLYAARDLNEIASIPLDGAFGRPVWLDDDRVLVAGANADALFNVDTSHQTFATIPLKKGAYPTGLARHGDTLAVATDGDLAVRIGRLDRLAGAKAIPIGGHIGELAFSPDGSTLFASNRSASSVVAIDTRSLSVRRLATGLHPSALLVSGKLLYVAETDADSVGVYDVTRGTRVADIFVGDAPGGQRLTGVSPNALAQGVGEIFVSLGAANSVAILKGRSVLARAPAGRYPADVVAIGDRLYVVNGKGEGSTANPYYHRRGNNFYDYVATLENGSVRLYDVRRLGAGNPQGMQGWEGRPADTVLREGGPIRHVFFILKENRTYDQVLGDAPGGNGDPKLAAFGARVTPNEHALAARFGLFDNTYTNGEVSEAGHDWSDAAFVTDYVQRTWPIDYGNRGTQNPSLVAARAVIPRNGYIWQAARAAGVSFRDYGESTNINEFAIATLAGAFDKRYVSFDLNYSDVDRYKEWRREFDGFIAHGTLPQLEYVWLPNDHTAASRAGSLTPVAYVAQNDYAVGLFVQAISHSPVWRSSAIFIIEDDSQDGPDHVSDQRTTLYVVSPYMRGGPQHTHYSTVSVLRSMELILGIPPLSAYDGMALPLYAAFGTTPNLTPYNVIAPKVSLTAKNRKVAYGSAVSARLDFSRADATAPGVLLDIIAHNIERQ